MTMFSAPRIVRVGAAMVPDLAAFAMNVREEVFPMHRESEHGL